MQLHSHFRAGLDALGIAVALVDANGKIAAANAAWARGALLRPLAGGELCDGTALLDALSRSSDAGAIELADALAELLEGVVPEVRVELGVREGDAERALSVTAAPFVADGVRYAALRLEDITARRAAEAQLRQAHEDAIEAARLKTEFLATVSHEIREPMNGMLGMTEMVLETDLTPEQSEYLQIAKSSAEALLALVNDILDFSKIEAQKLELENIGFDLHSVARNALHIVMPTARRKGIDLEFDLDPALREVQGDPTRLRQVLVNLLSNGVKFTDQGSVSLQLSGQPAPDGYLEVRFSVCDTGIGIAPASQDHIFQAFAQGDRSTTRRHGGTGLGLAISSQLVDLMGGRISVESEPGSGSVFHVDLRLAPAPSARESLCMLPLDRLRESRVLVVDDSATAAEQWVDKLASWGMRPSVAGSVDDAMSSIRQSSDCGEPFDLALVDLQMVGKDGFAFAELVREAPEVAGFPVILISIAGQRGDAAQCRQLGVAGYLTKPVGSPDLLEAVRTVLGLSEVGDQQAPLITRHLLREGRRPLRVLLAEDHLPSRKLSEHLLRKRGHEVIVVGDGRSAWKTATQEPFDVILMDVQMPGMDGYEATRRIRTAESPMRRVPIVALTAHTTAEVRQRCLNAGMDDYVSKPLRPESFYELIESLAQP